MRKHFLVALTLLSTAVLAAPYSAQAQNYPTRPIRIVVPFSPGTPVASTMPSRER